MEKIIIDGVDVSECKFFTQEQLHLGITCLDCLSQGNCNNSDCYYKQLKRKEKQCEELKKQYNCYACGNCKGKEDYINLEKHHKGLRKQFDKYHKALEEIKGIAEHEIKELTDSAINGGRYLEILDLITEAIGE